MEMISSVNPLNWYQYNGCWSLPVKLYIILLRTTAHLWQTIQTRPSINFTYI